MISNLNDMLRNKIYSFSRLDFVYYFDTLSEAEKRIIIKLILLDYYKVSFYIKKERSNIFNQDIDNLIDSIDDMRMILNLLKCAREFNSLDFVSKCMLFEEIKKYDEELISINKSHILDKMTYQVLDDLDCYKEYYFDYLCKHAKQVVNAKVIINYIVYRVSELKKKNKNHYKKMILEMLKVYYKWKNFIKDNGGENLLCDDEKIYLNIIKDKDIESIFIDLEKDSDFISAIIGEYLYYSTSNIEINETLVDQYFIENSSEEFKNKLKIKEL